LFGRYSDVLVFESRWVFGLGVGSGPGHKPSKKTIWVLDSEFNFRRFGIEINKCLNF